MVGLVIGIIIAAVIITVVLWVNGITYMNENYPEYKGWDLYNEEEGNEQD
jgi:hypothetical protein